MAKLCVLLLMASPLISALVATRAAPTTVVAPTLARSCDVAAAVRTQQRAAVVMMGRGGRQREDRPPKEKKEKDVLELEGTVLESLPNAMFRVQLQDSDAVSGLLMLQPRPARARLPGWHALRTRARARAHLTMRSSVALTRCAAGDSRPYLGKDPQELHQDPGTPTAPPHPALPAAP